MSTVPTFTSTVLTPSAATGRYWAFAYRMDARMFDEPPPNEPATSERYAFNIGWDLAMHRLSAPEDAPQAMLDGWKEASGRGTDKRAADRFIRKWLQVRQSAWRRNIPVAPTFTPDYLSKIDVSVCPISDECLTHGRGADSDWSIERLDNAIGYLPGNVAVVSRRVNELKGRLTAEQLEDEYWSACRADERLLPCGLEVNEAARLLALAAGPGAVLGKASHFPWPALALSPGVPPSSTGLISTAHVCIALGGKDPAADKLRFRRHRFAYKHECIKLMSNALLKRIRHTLEKGYHPCDVWLASEEMKTSWRAFWEALSEWEDSFADGPNAGSTDGADAVFDAARRNAEVARR